MAGAQFIGKEKLLAAFERRGGGTWQIAQGKKVCAKGSGSDDLAEWIDIFGAAQSRSPYTLHLFDDLDPEEIGKNSPDASWDFMISDNAGAVGSVSGTAGVVSKLQQKIDDRIAEKLGAMLDKADDPDDEPEGIDLNAIISDYAANPHKVGQAVGAVQQLVGMLKNLFGAGGAAPAQPMGAVGSLPGNAQQQPQGDDPDETYNRLCAVLDSLQKRDPKLLQHLEKLNKLDDLTFSLILSKLDAL